MKRLIVIMLVVVGFSSAKTAVQVFTPEGVIVGTFSTIQKGIDVCSKGETVIVGPGGTYMENVQVNKKIFLIGRDWPIITAAILATNTVTITADATIEGFIITGATEDPWGWPAYAGIRCQDSSPVITNNVIRKNNAYGVLLSYSAPKIVGNVIEDNLIGIYCQIFFIETSIFDKKLKGMYDGVLFKKGGIFFKDSSQPFIANNILKDNESGIFCYNSSPVIINNTIIIGTSSIKTICKRDPKNKEAIHCNNYSSPTIYNNIIVTTGISYGIRCHEERAFPTIDYNCVWGDNHQNNYGKCSAGSHDISTDPRFVSPKDFHLQSSSPCIDAGLKMHIPDWLTTDKDGSPRIINGIIDMGAYEFPPLKPGEPEEIIK